ncbi:MAG TPA: hypothetical protein VF520_01665 [Thermoleophilaceae bacterium]|jgi:hypothetical protein
MSTTTAVEEIAANLSQLVGQPVAWGIHDEPESVTLELFIKGRSTFEACELHGDRLLIFIGRGGDYTRVTIPTADLRLGEHPGHLLWKHYELNIGVH